MEEKKQTKIKFKTAVILIIIGVILLGGFCANVYASTNGYGNVFFLIKYLVTGEKTEVTEKDELLSDRDITISYEPIALTENLKIQIRNLQIKDNKAKLIIAVNENIKTNLTPLAYKVYNEENKLICEQNSSKKDSETDCIEELILKEFKNNDKLLYLEILNSKNEKLNRIIINLETREVTVEGEKEAIEKISEIELKKYLSIIAGYEKNFDVNDADSRISLAIRINSIINRNIVNNGLYDASEINNILKSLGYAEIPTNNYDGEFFKEKVVNGKKYFEMTYEPDTVSMETIVGEIKDINYSSNIYTATFKYLNYSPKTNINYFDYKDDAEEATIYFKLNDDKTYSTFNIIKYEVGEKININKNVSIADTITGDSTSNTNSTSIAKILKPNKKINRLIKNYEEAQNLIFNGTKIDEFYENEISKDMADAVWSGLKTEYKASSTHKKDTADYNVNNLDNLFTENCWCEGVSGTGIGEKIEVSAFGSSEKVNTYTQLNKNRNDETIEDVEEYLLNKYNEEHKQDNEHGGNYPTITKSNISNYSNEVNQIAIINGNAKTDELWKKNSRVKKLKLTIDDKVEYILELEDSKDLQLFDINYKNDSITKKLNLKFEILEVYSGEKYQDTCLTSLYLSGGIDIPWGGR